MEQMTFSSGHQEVFNVNQGFDSREHSQADEYEEKQQEIQIVTLNFIEGNFKQNQRGV